MKLVNALVLSAEVHRGAIAPDKADLKLEAAKAFSGADSPTFRVKVTVVEAPRADGGPRVRFAVELGAVFNDVDHPESPEAADEALAIVWPYIRTAFNQLSALVSLAQIPLPASVEGIPFENTATAADAADAADAAGASFGPKPQPPS
jgi:hypothetical protein